MAVKIYLSFDNIKLKILQIMRERYAEVVSTMEDIYDTTSITDDVNLSTDADIRIQTTALILRARNMNITSEELDQISSAISVQMTKDLDSGAALPLSYPHPLESMLSQIQTFLMGMDTGRLIESRANWKNSLTTHDPSSNK